MVKRKPGFRELEPVLRAAVERGVLEVPESEAHRIESAARPDLPLLELLRDLSRGLRLEGREPAIERQLAAVLRRQLPERKPRPSDTIDLQALALALVRCRLVTCDALMADVVHRSGLDVRLRCELYSGRRGDVDRLRQRIEVALAGLGGRARERLNPGAKGD